MGWRGHETKIDVGMIFKKMYCHKCGERLKKKKITEVYKKGEPGFKKDLLGHDTIGMTEIAISHYIYECPNCNSEIDYETQCTIAKKQKVLKKSILSENEID